MEIGTQNRRASHYMYSILSSNVSGTDASLKQNGSKSCLDYKERKRDAERERERERERNRRRRVRKMKTRLRTLTKHIS